MSKKCSEYMERQPDKKIKIISPKQQQEQRHRHFQSAEKLLPNVLQLTVS